MEGYLQKEQRKRGASWSFLAIEGVKPMILL